jgi:hypothetical protein
MGVFNFGPASLLFPFNSMGTFLDYATGNAWVNDQALPLGDGFPVLVFPGFGASGAATAYLRAKLGQLRHEVYDWDGGINVGHAGAMDSWLSPLSAQLRRIHELHGRQVSIIGWSLGGTYAHALRNKHPDLVGQVVTLGTPFEPSPYICGAEARPLMARSLSIYSRSDGVIDWEKCLLPEVGGHSNVEVTGVDHFGMIYHRKVLKIIAEFLLRKAGYRTGKGPYFLVKSEADVTGRCLLG